MLTSLKSNVNTLNSVTCETAEPSTLFEPNQSLSLNRIMHQSACTPSFQVIFLPSS
jgi:hypothetical protein